MIHDLILEKLPNPTTGLPTGQTTGVDISPDGNYVAVTHYNSPFITLYKRNNDTFTKLPNPTGGLPNSIGRSPSFSPDGEFLAVASAGGSPYLIIYKRNGDSFTKVPDPVGGIPIGVNILSFSPDGKYLAAGATAGTEKFVLYKVESEDTFNRINLGFSESVYGISFSKDNTYICVNHGYSNGTSATIFKKEVDSYIKTMGLAGLPTTGVSNGSSFSPDGKLLSIASPNAPYLINFKIENGNFDKLPNPEKLPPSSANSTSFSENGKYLVVAHDATPFASLYKVENENFNKLEDNFPTGDFLQGKDAKFYPNLDYMLLASSRTPFINIYKVTILYNNKFLISSEDKYYSLMVKESLNQVPKMTTNTLPMGEVLSSSTNSTNNEWRAFDGDLSSYWQTSSSMIGDQWLRYKFTNPVVISSYALTNSSITLAPESFKLQGSDDGVTFFDLDTQLNVSDWVSNEKRIYKISNNTAYLYYRLFVISNNGGSSIRVNEFELLNKEDKAIIEIPTLSESSFLNYGMYKLFDIQTDTDFDQLTLVKNSLENLGSGKVFTQKIDTTKTPINKTTIT